MYRLYVRDQYLNRVAEITDYQRLELLPRFNAVGSWILEIPTDSRAAKEIIKPQAGIIVVKDGITLFSGSVDEPDREWDMSQDKITVAGYDDMKKLLNVAYPVPSGDFTLQDSDIRTGKAETIMKQYVDVNLGPNALSERRTLALEVDRGLGNTVTGRGRFHTLLELFQGLALSGGDLGFRVVQVNKTLEFQVYQPSDKTRAVFFSPLLGNLLNFKYSVKAPEANYIIIGGGGEGASRIILQRGDNTSIAKYGRIESFIDQRNTTDIAELQQAIDEELISKGERTSLSITPIDTPSVAFGKDYNLGDKVSVVITQPNEIVDVDTVYYFISSYQTVPVETSRIRKVQEKINVIQDVIREIKITITPGGESISPMIGTPDSLSKNVPKIYDRVKKAFKRISNLERG